MKVRYAWQIKEKLRIHKVEGGYIIGLDNPVRNVVHGDKLCFVLFETLEQARDAAKHLSELRKIQYCEKLD